MTIAPRGPSLVRPASPYRGLAPFEETELDALLFFGREQEREVVTANLAASRLTVLYGPSGVGKSSLLRAGVAHALNRTARENSDRHGRPEMAAVVVSAWSADPIQAIIESARAVVSALTGGSISTPTGGSLADALAPLTEPLDGDLYLILDQLEDYFFYHGGEDGGPLSTELPELLARAEPRVNVLLALREDTISRVDAFAARIPGILGNRLRLRHLERESARAAILGPLGRWNELGTASRSRSNPSSSR